MSNTINSGGQNYITDVNSFSSNAADATANTNSVSNPNLTKIISADITTTGKISPAAGDATSLLILPGQNANVAQPSDLIAALDKNTDVNIDIFAVAALLQKTAQQMRNADQMKKAAESHAEIASMKAGANEMRSAAEQRFTAAVTQGAIQIGTGALQVGAGASSFKQGISAGKASSEAAGLEDAGMKSLRETNPLARREDMDFDTLTKSNALRAKAELLNRKADFTNTTSRGMGDAMSGVGTMASGALEKNAAMDDAQKQDLDAEAKLHDASSQSASDAAQKMDDLIKSLRDMVGQIQQQQSETNISITRNV